jgi:hypothetical protein
MSITLTPLHPTIGVETRCCDLSKRQTGAGDVAGYQARTGQGFGPLYAQRDYDDKSVPASASAGTSASALASVRDAAAKAIQEAAR